MGNWNLIVAFTNLLNAGLLGKLENWLLPLGIMLLIAWAMMRLANRKRKTGNILSASEQLERNRQARGMQGDLEQLMVEIEQLARRFSSQLDAKTVHLEQLIAEADERIKKLESLEGSATSAAKTDPTDAETAPPKVSAPPNEPEQPDDPLTESIYQLADSGLDAHKIATELGEHVGKVELILALRQSK